MLNFSFVIEISFFLGERRFSHSCGQSSGRRGGISLVTFIGWRTCDACILQKLSIRQQNRLKLEQWRVEADAKRGLKDDVSIPARPKSVDPGLLTSYMIY